jgi:prepilin-type N-terminal cleavage/methylation domain-containing protein
MTSRRHHEAGDTLVEILIAIVLIGIVASGSFFAISVGATTSKSQRDAVTADAALRAYAEATKQAVRDVPCTSANAGASFAAQVNTDYNPSPGFPPVTATGLTCPSITTLPLTPVVITAHLQSGITKVLSVDVRTP